VRRSTIVPALLGLTLACGDSQPVKSAAADPQASVKKGAAKSRAPSEDEPERVGAVDPEPADPDPADPRAEPPADPPAQERVAVDEREPPAYPDQSTPDPPSFHHPPAKEVIVVASNRSFSPGKDGVDRDAKFHSFIWRPGEGALGEQEGESGSPLVTHIEGLVVADGQRAWELALEDVTVQVPKCDCKGPEPRASSRTLGKKMFQLSARPFVDGAASGEAQILIAADDYERATKLDCISARPEIEHVLQVASIAGPKLFVVERVRDADACTEDEENSRELELRKLRVLDLAGGSSDLTSLEAQLSYSERKRARTDASEALAEFSAASAYALAPSELELTGVFPRFREYKTGVRLVLQYSVDAAEGSGGWGSLADATQVTLRYPAASTLAASTEAEQLITYVQREFGQWKVLGWSQIDAGEG
jgi:hypothetical protein